MKSDHGRPVEEASTTGGLPVSMSLAPTLNAANVPAQANLITGHVVKLCGLAIVLGLAVGGIAVTLKHLIGLVTNLSFYQTWDTSFASPAGAVPHLGLWVIPIPVIGGIIVGFMARYGSKAIRGHGIPEAMEQVLLKQSKIPARMTFLKPLSAAVAIGTGGPFGAEGPIIATGGALGSLVGQLMPTSPDERKTLLAAGAAAGMAATFGSPISAVILAIELLLFEYRPRSLVPVAFAAATATSVHIMTEGASPVFPMPGVAAPSAGAMVAYILIGALIGVLAMLVTRAVYWVEDLFELLPIHWMWWPAIGGLAVGIVGYFVPLTLGVGYSNITHMLTFDWSLKFIAILCVAKFLSWVIALGSGTSGGTLAPLFTIGGAIGALLGALGTKLVPGAHIDPRIGALVGMAAIFAGASRAMLASVVFAFETTLQPMGLLPLLGGCTMAYLVSCVTMKETIMTEKLARRGTRVPAEYSADFLDQILVRDVASKHLKVLRSAMTLHEVRTWIAQRADGSTHQGFPLVDDAGHVVGVITRRDLLNPEHPDDRVLATLLKRPPIVCYDDSTLREAADHMVNHDIGRLPVVARAEPGRLVGIITRSDLLKAHRRRLSNESERTTTIEMPFLKTA